MGILKRKAGPRLLPVAKPGDCCFKWSNCHQNSFSALSAGRSRLAWDNPLRLGGVAPRIVESGPECSWSESHKSLSPMQWVSCASIRLTVWLQGLKVRALSSTPVSRAILETSCSGIRLQIWRKTLNRLRVGLMIFWFFIPAVWQVQNVKPTLFFIFCGMAVVIFHWFGSRDSETAKQPTPKNGTFRFNSF